MSDCICFDGTPAAAMMMDALTADYTSPGKELASRTACKVELGHGWGEAWPLLRVVLWVAVEVI